LYMICRSFSFQLHTLQVSLSLPSLALSTVSHTSSKQRLGKMLDIGKVPGQSYAQLPKSKAANASAAKYAASQR
jgi:hypothetical protein